MKDPRNIIGHPHRPNPAMDALRADCPLPTEKIYEFRKPDGSILYKGPAKPGAPHNPEDKTFVQVVKYLVLTVVLGFVIAAIRLIIHPSP